MSFGEKRGEEVRILKRGKLGRALGKKGDLKTLSLKEETLTNLLKLRGTKGRGIKKSLKPSLIK